MSAPVRCEACGADAVAFARREPTGVELWACRRCGDAKRWCPRCEQGWVRRRRVTVTATELYSCDECEATWPEPNAMRPPGTDLRTYLRRAGIITWPLDAAIIREREGEDALTDRIALAWRRAAVDLGIRVTAPYVTTDEAGGAVEFHALVHDFGSPHGALVAVMGEPRRRVEGFFVSHVNPEVYATYDRQTFVDTLEDWGWFGTGAPPDWYRGVSPWG